MPSFFDKLKKTVQNLVGSFRPDEERVYPPEPPAWEDEMEDSMDMARDIIMGYIESEQPYGEQEEAITLYNKDGDEVYHRKAQYPSERTGHIPISEGWHTETDRILGRLRLTFTNESQHVWWVIEGTEEEYWDIPYSSPNKLLFWWGAPQKWPQRDGKPAGPRVFPWVRREKPRPNPFPSRVAQYARAETKDTIKVGVNDYILRVLQDTWYT